MAFNYNVKILQDFTPDSQKLSKAFARMDHFEG
jgi:hypothetical protein